MEWLLQKIIMLPGIVIGLSLHEFGHAKVAQLCGDDTSYRMGRVSLNPLDHIDPLGLISLFFIGFGWGKPVIINPTKFKKPRRDSIFVGLAGVAMNFIVALAFAFIWRLYLQFGGAAAYSSNMGSVISQVLSETIVINLSLLLFNLIPIPPLDGFGVLSDIINLPRLNYNLYQTIRQYGYYVLLVCILLNIPSKLLSAPLNALWSLIIRIAFVGYL